MWNMHQDKAAYTLLESVLSLLLLSLVFLTMLGPITRNLEILAEKRAETEHWRLLQDTVAQRLHGGKRDSSQRVSAGQVMEVRWHLDGRGVSLVYSAKQGHGSVEVVYVEE